MNRTVLVWRYFFKQKWEEIYDYFEEWWGAYCGISLIISLFLQFGWISTQEYYSDVYDPLNPTMAIIGLCILGFWALIFLTVLLMIIYEWLHDNWEEANKRADKEMKKFALVAFSESGGGK